MSQAQSSSEYGSNEVASGITLASVTAGIIAAALFLLVSSYLSNDASWNVPSDRVWVSTSLTGNDLSASAWQKPASEQLRTVRAQSPNQKSLNQKSHYDETAHFSDALYSADFMNSFAEPI